MLYELIYIDTCEKKEIKQKQNCVQVEYIQKYNLICV